MSRKTIQIDTDTFNIISDICSKNSISKYTLVSKLLSKALDDRELLQAVIDESNTVAAIAVSIDPEVLVIAERIKNIPMEKLEQFANYADSDDFDDADWEEIDRTITQEERESSLAAQLSNLPNDRFSIIIQEAINARRTQRG